MHPDARETRAGGRSASPAINALDHHDSGIARSLCLIGLTALGLALSHPRLALGQGERPSVRSYPNAAEFPEARPSRPVRKPPDLVDENPQFLPAEKTPPFPAAHRAEETEPVAKPLIDPGTLASSIKVLAAVTVLGLVPSILMMTTCFVRFSIVMGLLRQALGTPQALPNQILTALAMFLTFLVMAPVWQRSYDEGIRPYTQPSPGAAPMDEATAFQRSAAPLREFMSRQIDQSGNADAVWMLIDYQRPAPDSPAFSAWREPASYDDVPLTVLAPAYLLSELKVAFLIGFQIFLPFLVIDLVVASILTSLGLTMLPPSMVSLPFKLLLFVLIDGWFLTVGMLLESVRVT